MPNGITSDLYEGKEVTLRGYLMRVGRQMMFAVRQRDDNSHDPVELPENDPVLRYEREAVEKARARVAELEGLDRGQVAQAAHASFLAEHAAWQKSRDHEAEVRARYDAMRAQVEAWEPDPLVAYVKEYALRYLDESMEFDCPVRAPLPEGQKLRWFSEPEELGPREWYEREMAEAQRSLASSEEYLAERTLVEHERRQQIEAFLRSLPEEGS